MDIRLLGTVEASVDGRAVAVAPGKPRALLAMLALHAGSTVSSERLIGGLWAEPPPATATKLVQLHVSQLRKALGAQDLLTRGRGYELRLGPEDLDVSRFQRLVAAGRPREGLALWRGPPLDDVAGEPFAAAEINRLEELRLAAVELAIEHDLAAGRHRECVGELERLVLEEPLRERLHAHRMLALYRSGRQADALEAYRHARAVLVEASGVEPGTELRHLHEAILRQDSALAAAPLIARRVARAASRIEAERPELRLAEDDMAANVFELQAARARHETDARVVVCPFKGLASYDVEDAEYFFGRERLVAELVARLTGAGLTAIVGASGSGKSSVLRAGVLAALAGGVLPGSERWPSAVLRPGEHPLQELDRVSPDGDGRQVIAVDQFEELFTLCSDERERAAFAAALCERARHRAIVLIAIRADFYGHCAEHPELARRLAASNVLVGTMRRDELRRVIELPARRAGLEVDAELTDVLLADVEGRPGGLPLLSTALLELWQHRDGQRLRMSAYEHAGGVQGAVARLAERAYERLEPERRPVARRIFMRLAGDGDQDAVVRRRVPTAELDGDGVAEVLTVLADERLVTLGEDEVEVAHEALLREWPRLRGWLEEDAQGRRLRAHLREAARGWDEAGRDPGELYRGARLAAALEWAAAHDGEPNAVERDFIAASRAASQRSQRRLRAVVAGLGVLLALAVVAGAVALDQRAGARREATAAEAQRLGARALVEDDLDLSLLLARQGVELDDTPQTRDNLLAALLRTPAAIGVLRGDGDRVIDLDVSPDERTLAFLDTDGTLSLVDLRTRRPIGAAVQLPGHVGIIDALVTSDHVQFSPDGTRLAVGGQEPVVLDTRTRRVVAELDHAGVFVYAQEFSPDGRTIMAVVADPFVSSTLQRFDASTGKPVGSARVVSNLLVTMLVSGDGRRVVTSSTETDTVVHDATTLRPLRRWPRRPTRSALSPDGRTLLLGGADGSVGFLDLRRGTVREASAGHDSPVERAAFSPDGTSAVTAAADSRILVWDVERASVREALTGHSGQVSGLEFSDDAETLYSSGLDSKVVFWDLAGSQRIGRPFAIPDNEDSPRFSLRHDGRELAIGDDDGTIALIDARTLRPRSTFRATPRGRSPAWATSPARACSSSAERTASWPSSIRPAGGRSRASRGRRAMS